MTKEITKKYLDNLLKSGIPLEYEANSILEQSGYLTLGEFRYERKNEDNRLTEFSTDILANYSDQIEQSHFDVHLLIECKYGNNLTKWFFYPEPVMGPDFSLQILDRISLYKNRMEFDPLWDAVPGFIRTMQKCYKGVSINDKDRDESKIEHATNQILYAIPNLVYKCLEGTASSTSDEDGFAQLIIPIIVTNVELRVLNEGTDINKISSATSVDEVSTIEKYIKLRPGSSIQLDKYVRAVIADLSAEVNFQKYLKKYLENPKSKYYLNEETIKTDIVDQTLRAMDTIFVVNSTHLKEFVENIKIMFSNINLEQGLRIVQQKYGFKIEWILEESIG